MTTVSRISSDGNLTIGNAYYPAQNRNYSSLFTNNTSQYLAISSPAVPSTGQFTFEAWIYTSVSAIQTIYSQYLASDSNRWLITIDVNSGYKLSIGHGTAATAFANSVVPLNQWNHVAITRDASNNLRFFLNGVLDGTTASYTATLGQNSPRISGFVTGGTAYPFQGYVSNLRILSGVALYTASFTVPSSPLTAIAGTTLLTCQTSTVVDRSPNVYTITNNGTVTTTNTVTPFATQSSSLDDYTLNALNYSVGFNGTTTQYLSIPANTAFRQDQGNWTVECWIYLTAVGTTSRIPLSMGTYLSVDNFVMYVNAAGALGYEAGTGAWSAAANYESAAGAIVANTWYHIAFVRNGTTFTSYINGAVAKTQASASFGVGASNLLYIGNYFAANYGFTGYISNVRIVNGTAVYTAAFTPPTSPLTAIAGTVLLTCQSPTIIDNSTNKFTITNNGAATINRIATTFYKNYFNGSGYYLSTPSTTAFSLTANFTVEAWVYPIDAGRTNDALKYGELITQGVSGSNTNFWGFYFLISGGVITGAYIDVGAATAASFTGLSISLNAWHHIAWVRNGSTITLYVDGVSVGTPVTYATSLTYNASGSVNIARSVFGGAFENWLKGYVSNLRVVNGTAVYTAAFTPSTQQLTAIANTVLLTCQSSSIIDNSVYNSTITNNGTVTVQNPILLGTVQKQYPDGSLQTLGDIDEYTIPNSRYCVGFNGAQYLAVPTYTGTTTATDFGTGAFTIEGWFYYTNAAVTNEIFCWRNYASSAFDGQFAVYLATANKLSFSDGTTVTTGTTTLSANTWYHVAIVRISTTLYWYVNGVLDASAAYSTNIVNRHFIIGNIDGGFTGYNFNGFISNVRIVKGIAVYTAAFTPPTSPLQAINGTSLLTCQNPTIIDNSLNNFSITNSGTAVTTNIPTNFYSTLFVSSSSQYLTTATASISSYDFSNGNYTIEFWMNPGTFATETAILCAGPSTSGALNRGWALELHNGTSAGLWFYQAGVVTSWTNIGSYTANVWQHIAIVRNGTTILAYVNGVSVGTTSAGTSTQTAFSAGDIFFIGALQTGANAGRFFYNGSMSNLRIVKGYALYQSNFTPPKKKLSAIAGTSLLTCQSATIIDNSTNALTITNNGTATVKAPQYTNLTAVQQSNGVYQIAGEFDEYSGINDNPNYALTFNGTSQYLTLTSNAAFALGTNNFTIEFWINLTTTPGIVNAVYDNRPASTQGVYPHLYLTTDRTIRFFVSSADRITSSAMTLNTWYHVAIVRNSKVTTMYLNGVQTGSTYADTNSYLQNGTIIGGSYGGGAGPISNFFSGYLSNLRVVNGRAIYVANFTPPISPLNAVPGTALLTAQNATIIDNSSNVFTITNNGAVTTSANTSMFIP